MSNTQITVTTDPPMSELLRRAAQSQKNANDKLGAIISRQSVRFVRFAQSGAPKRTGQYAANIRSRPLTVSDGAGFEVLSPAPLGKWIQQGTRPHPIVARRVKFLRFYWPKVGRVVYFRSVNHPGTKPNPFMAVAYKQWLPGAQRDLNNVGMVWAKTMRGGA